MFFGDNRCFCHITNLDVEYFSYIVSMIFSVLKKYQNDIALKYRYINIIDIFPFPKKNSTLAA